MSLSSTFALIILMDWLYEMSTLLMSCSFLFLFLFWSFGTLITYELEFIPLRLTTIYKRICCNMICNRLGRTHLEY